MSKRVHLDLDSKLKFEKMLDAYKRTAKGKQIKNEVNIFSMDLATNITNILKDIYEEKYVWGKFREFKVYEPKERIIKALPFKDRVTQQWYVEEFVKPLFLNKFIYDSYACIPDKGPHLSVSNLNKKLSKKVNKYCIENKVSYNYAINNMYILKCDIAKFFYSINKEILFEIIKKNCKGKKFLEFTKKILDSDDSLVGIPIGSYSSQFFANIYMNELDHYIKENLHISIYCRYMDDFICVFNSKDECIKNLVKIQEFVEKKLKLKLNAKTQYFKVKQGVNFLGFRVFCNKIELTSRNKRRIQKKVKKYNKKYKLISKDFKEVRKLYDSYCATKGYYKNNVKENIFKKFEEELDIIYKQKG